MQDRQNRTKQKILIVDDEADMLDLMASSLKPAGYEILRAVDGREALRQARGGEVALIILDIMLPEMSGIEVCKILKRDSTTAGIPIIMVSAKTEEIDRIVGLEVGADDYVTKPFSPRELALRVGAVLRTTAFPGTRNESLKVEMIQVDRSRCEVLVGGKPVELTATEFKLLILLMERRGRMQTRDVLLNEVWGYEALIETRTVDTHMRRLRDKLGEAGSFIETVRGFGYRMISRDG